MQYARRTLREWLLKRRGKRFSIWLRYPHKRSLGCSRRSVFRGVPCSKSLRPVSVCSFNDDIHVVAAQVCPAWNLGKRSHTPVLRLSLVVSVRRARLVRPVDPPRSHQPDLRIGTAINLYARYSLPLPAYGFALDCADYNLRSQFLPGYNTCVLLDPLA